MQTIVQDMGAVPALQAGSSGRLYAGRVLSGLAVAFLLFDSAGKLFQAQPVIEGTIALGYPRDIVFSLGVILLSCVLEYVIPSTSPSSRRPADRCPARRMTRTTTTGFGSRRS